MKGFTSFSSLSISSGVFLSFLFSCVIYVCFFLAIAEAADTPTIKGTSIGRIIQVTPEAWILRDNVKIKPALKDPIGESDSLLTGAHGNLQILFADDTILTVGPSSQVDIRNFLYDDSASSHLDFRFAAGISRIISGKIVEKNPEGFKVSTPLATIGIRGTMLSIIRPSLSHGGPAAIPPGTPDKVVLEQLGKGHSVIVSMGSYPPISMKRAGYTVTLSPDTGLTLASTTQTERATLQALGIRNEQNSTQPNLPTSRHPVSRIFSPSSSQDKVQENILPSTLADPRTRQAGTTNQEQVSLPNGNPSPAPEPDLVPEQPDTPVVPDVPDTPDIPDVPDNPDTPDVPDNPDTPDVPDNPDTPDVPDNPDTPDVPDNPDTPDVPDVPEQPDTQLTPPVAWENTELYAPEAPHIPSSLPINAQKAPTVDGLAFTAASQTVTNYYAFDAATRSLSFAARYPQHNIPFLTFQGIGLADNTSDVLRFESVSGSTLGSFLGESIVSASLTPGANSQMWTIQTKGGDHFFKNGIQSAPNAQGHLQQTMTVTGVPIGILNMSFLFDENKSTAVMTALENDYSKGFRLEGQGKTLDGLFSYDLVPSENTPKGVLFNSQVEGGHVSGKLDGTTLKDSFWNLKTSGALLASGSGIAAPSDDPDTQLNPSVDWGTVSYAPADPWNYIPKTIPTGAGLAPSVHGVLFTPPTTPEESNFYSFRPTEALLQFSARQNNESIPFLAFSGTGTSNDSGGFLFGVTPEGNPSAIYGSLLGEPIVYGSLTQKPGSPDSWLLMTTNGDHFFKNSIQATPDASGKLQQQMLVNGLPIGVLNMTFLFNKNTSTATMTAAENSYSTGFHLEGKGKTVNGAFSYDLLPLAPGTLFNSQVEGGHVSGKLNGTNLEDSVWHLKTNGSLIATGTGNTLFSTSQYEGTTSLDRDYFGLAAQNSLSLEVIGQVTSPQDMGFELNITAHNENAPFLYTIPSKGTVNLTSTNGYIVTFGGGTEKVGEFLGQDLVSLTVTTLDASEDRIPLSWKAQTAEGQHFFSSTLGVQSIVNGRIDSIPMNVNGISLGEISMSFNFPDAEVNATMKGIGLPYSDFTLAGGGTIIEQRFDVNVQPVGSDTRTLFGSEVTGGNVSGQLNDANTQLLNGSWQLQTNGALSISGSATPGKK